MSGCDDWLSSFIEGEEWGGVDGSSYVSCVHGGECVMADGESVGERGGD